MCHLRPLLSATLLATGARWFFWSKDVGLEVVDLSFFSNFVDGRRRILVKDSTGTFLGRRATMTRASLCAAGLFIDPQSLFGDGAFLRSCNGGGSASLTMFVLAVLKLGGSRSLWWFQETLGIILYFSIS
jgi:hypothetical protein